MLRANFPRSPFAGPAWLLPAGDGYTIAVAVPVPSSSSPMASSLFVLLDDIATILDDVSVMTKVAAKKTAGILGDDLALNAQQVTGVESNRELPVVWAVAVGSFFNKVVLIPIALLMSSFAAWAIEPLMIAGGTFLCYEGCEKIAHKWLHPKEATQHSTEHRGNVIDPAVDLVAVEKAKVRGAIRTDFILSAEIIVITLGAVSSAPFVTQVGVLIAIGLLMTVGVYGLVAGIVKLDDLGLWLIRTPPEKSLASLKARLGHTIIAAAPYLMRFLSIAGTAAMFLVGGGILVHGIGPLHHWIEGVQESLGSIGTVGGILSSLSAMSFNAIVGIIAGAAVLMVVNFAKSLRGKP